MFSFQPTEDVSANRGGNNTPNVNSGTSSVRSSVRSRVTVEETHIGKYHLIKTIGKGNFAKVKLARHVPTDKEASLSGFINELVT